MMQALEKAEVPSRHHLMVGSNGRGMHSRKQEAREVFRDLAHFYNTLAGSQRHHNSLLLPRATAYMP